jgi:hypothetical protein
VKALLVPESNGKYSIELVSETKQERRELCDAWIHDKLDLITSEEFRELQAIKDSIGRRKTDEEDD